MKTVAPRSVRAAAVVIAAGLGGLRAGPPRILGPDSSKQLLLDPRVVQSVEHAKLALGTVEKDPRNPLLRADQPWENALNNLYPNVWWDEREGIFKLWYKCVLTDPEVIAKMADPVTIHGQGWYLLYATSRDGLTWEKPAVGQFEFGGSRANNAVARDTPNAGVFADPHDPDPARRFKMVYDVGLGKLRTRTSPDGVHWSAPLEPRGFARYNGDTHNNAFWDEQAGCYVWFTRAYLGERLVARFESPDFVNWTPSGVVLRSSLAEGRAHQTYCMPVFPYANGYLGFVMLYHLGAGRTVDCELAWSPDSVNWRRVAPGVPFIPRGPQGSCDSACIYAPAGPAIARDGKLLIFYGGDFFPHQGWKRHCLPCLARLREDGFAGYEPDPTGARAAIVTQPLLVTGPIRVSADVAGGGSVRVSVLDEPAFGTAPAEPIAQDVTDGEVSWPGTKPDALFGKIVRLRCELQRAKLYAISGVQLVPPPQASTAIRRFPGSLAVDLQPVGAPAGAVVRFTTDGSEPTIASPAWSGRLRIGATVRLRARACPPGAARGGAEFDETFTRVPPRRAADPGRPATLIAFDGDNCGWRGLDRLEHVTAGGVRGGYVRASRGGGLRPFAFAAGDAADGLGGDWPRRFGGQGADIVFHARCPSEGGGCHLELFAGDVAAWSYAAFPGFTADWQPMTAEVRWDWNDAEAAAAGWVRGSGAFSWRETMAHVGKVVVVAGQNSRAAAFDLDEFRIAPFAE